MSQERRKSHLSFFFRLYGVCSSLGGSRPVSTDEGLGIGFGLGGCFVVTDDGIAPFPEDELGSDSRRGGCALSFGTHFDFPLASCSRHGGVTFSFPALRPVVREPLIWVPPLEEVLDVQPLSLSPQLRSDPPPQWPAVWPWDPSSRQDA